MTAMMAHSQIMQTNITSLTTELKSAQRDHHAEWRADNEPRRAKVQPVADKAATAAVADISTANESATAVTAMNAAGVDAAAMPAATADKVVTSRAATITVTGDKQFINAKVNHQHLKIWGADNADDPFNNSGGVPNNTTALFTVLTPGAATGDDTTATTPAPAGHYTTVDIPVNHIPPNTTPHLCYRAPFQLHGTPCKTTVNHLPVATAIELPLNPVPPNTTPHLLRRAPSNSFNIDCSPLNTTINRLPVATAVGIAVNPVPPNTTPHLIHLAPSPPARFAHL